MDEPVIELRNITARYRGEPGLFVLGGARGPRALLDVSLCLYPGQTLGLIGESGAGKSSLALVITGRLRPERGEIRFDGADLARLSGKALQVRTRRLQLLSQEPIERFDRERSVGKLLAEELTQRGLAEGAAAAREKLAAALAAVELAPALLDRRPTELSGGELQRTAIARIVALNPKVIALDEPVAGVDPHLRERLLHLLRRLQVERRYAYLYISHDLAQVRRMAPRLAVLYRGRIVEAGPTADVLGRPRHPHTAALLAALSSRPADPSPDRQPPGCPYQPHCPMADSGRCRSELPLLREVAPEHAVACHLA